MTGFRCHWLTAVWCMQTVTVECMQQALSGEVWPLHMIGHAICAADFPLCPCCEVREVSASALSPAQLSLRVQPNPVDASACAHMQMHLACQRSYPCVAALSFCQSRTLLLSHAGLEKASAGLRLPDPAEAVPQPH